MQPGTKFGLALCSFFLLSSSVVVKRKELTDVFLDEGAEDAEEVNPDDEVGPAPDPENDFAFTQWRVKQSYLNCHDADDKQVMAMYTVRRNTTRTSVDRFKCVSRRELNFDSRATWIALTMSDSVFYDNLRELLASLMVMPGLPPKKVVVADVGLLENQTQELLRVLNGTGPPIEIVRYDVKPYQAIESKPEFPKEGKSGAYYRLKAVIIHEWFEKGLADQLMWMDAGGIFLGGTDRVRNFVTAEGLYAGALPESALSQITGGALTAPEVQNERRERLDTEGVLPQCFDYTRDYQVDDTTIEWLADNTSGKANVTWAAAQTTSLGSFEAGLIIADSRHPWVHELLRRWSSIMASDTLFLKNLAYFFPFDQKVFTNEIWKMAVCGAPGTRRLVDTDNVRFGTAVQLHNDTWKGRFSFQGDEEPAPWTGYAYHYCMPDNLGHVRHRCLPRHQLWYKPNEWVKFAAH